MTAPHAEQLIDGYLARLRDAAADLPKNNRNELIDDMRSHIAEARSRESGPETEATILNILDRLGDPAVVVTDARDRLGIGPEPAFRPGLVEFAAMFLLPFIWPFGVILLWSSRAWKTRDKIIASLVPPGGYFGFAFIAFTAHAAGFIVQGPFPGSGHLYILLIPILVFFAPVYLFARLRAGGGRVSSRPRPGVRGPVS